MDCPIREKCKLSEDSRNVITCNRCMTEKLLKIKKIVKACMIRKEIMGRLDNSLSYTWKSTASTNANGYESWTLS